MKINVPEKVMKEDEITVNKCIECRRVICELENLGVKFANCTICENR